MLWQLERPQLPAPALARVCAYGGRIFHSELAFARPRVSLSLGARLALVRGEARLSVGSEDRHPAPTGHVVAVTYGGKEELYDVGVPSASEAELAVGKFLQASDLLSINAIGALSSAAVKALRLAPGEVRLRRSSVS